MAVLVCAGSDEVTSQTERLRDYELACRITAQVREEADDRNIPLPGSGFAAYMAAVWPTQRGASCFQYSGCLEAYLLKAGISPSRIRELGIYLNKNVGEPFDSHSVVELEHEGRFVILDPTNGLALELASGKPATKEEIQTAVRAGQWSAIRNRFLTPKGDYYLKLIDYIPQPVYYLNCRPYDSLDFRDPETAGLYECVPVGGALPKSIAILDPLAQRERPTVQFVAFNGVSTAVPCNPLSYVFESEGAKLPSGVEVWTVKPQAFGVAPGPLPSPDRSKD